MGMKGVKTCRVLRRVPATKVYVNVCFIAIVVRIH